MVEYKVRSREGAGRQAGFGALHADESACRMHRDSDRRAYRMIQHQPRVLRADSANCAAKWQRSSAAHCRRSGSAAAVTAGRAGRRLSVSSRDRLWCDHQDTHDQRLRARSGRVFPRHMGSETKTRYRYRRLETLRRREARTRQHGANFLCQLTDASP
jgi:hypothetical protein